MRSISDLSTWRHKLKLFVSSRAGNIISLSSEYHFLLSLFSERRREIFNARCEEEKKKNVSRSAREKKVELFMLTLALSFFQTQWDPGKYVREISWRYIICRDTLPLKLHRSRACTSVYSYGFPSSRYFWVETTYAYTPLSRWSCLGCEEEKALLEWATNNSTRKEDIGWRKVTSSDERAPT